METGCSTSVEMCYNPNTTIKGSGEKKVHWMDEVTENNREREVNKQKSIGTFGKEEVYFYGEVENWVTERFGKPNWRIVPQDELWRWSKERLERIVSGKSVIKEGDLGNKVKKVMGKEDEGEASREESSYRQDDVRDVGPAETVLEYLKRRVLSDTSQSTVYNLCQDFYEENQGQSHSDHTCAIGICVLYASEEVYWAQHEEQEGSYEEEGRMTGRKIGQMS